MLYNAIKYLFPSAQFGSDFSLADDGNGGVYVSLWNIDAPMPSQAELEAAATAATRGPAWERIKAERDRRKSLGVQVGDYWFHSDADSRIQQLGLVMMGASIPPGLQWKTMSGAFVTMTAMLAGQIFQAVAMLDQALFANAEQHRAAMEASADPAAYDYSTGWAPAYGEA